MGTSVPTSRLHWRAGVVPKSTRVSDGYPGTWSGTRVAHYPVMAALVAIAVLGWLLCASWAKLLMHLGTAAVSLLFDFTSTYLIHLSYNVEYNEFVSHHVCSLYWSNSFDKVECCGLGRFLFSGKETRGSCGSLIMNRTPKLLRAPNWDNTAGVHKIIPGMTLLLHYCS